LTKLIVQVSICLHLAKQRPQAGEELQGGRRIDHSEGGEGENGGCLGRAIAPVLPASQDGGLQPLSFTLLLLIGFFGDAAMLRELARAQLLHQLSFFLDGAAGGRRLALFADGGGWRTGKCWSRVKQGGSSSTNSSSSRKPKELLLLLSPPRRTSTRQPLRGEMHTGHHRLVRWSMWPADCWGPDLWFVSFRELVGMKGSVCLGLVLHFLLGAQVGDRAEPGVQRHAP
jgi:hypothetical protein